MSLLNRFNELFCKLFRGRATTYREQVNECMRNMGADYGWDGDMCVCQFQGHVFSIRKNEGLVQIAALSNVKFDSLPPKVVSALTEMNKELNHCEYDAVDAPPRSYFYIRSFLKMGHLSLEMLRGAIGELGDRIKAFDVMMVKYGYG